DASGGIGCQHRSLCLLELQQQCGTVSIGKQPDGAEQTETADAYQLECNGNQAIAIKQHPPVFPLGHLVSLKSRAGAKFVRIVKRTRKASDLWVKTNAPARLRMLQ